MVLARVRAQFSPPLRALTAGSGAASPEPGPGRRRSRPRSAAPSPGCSPSPRPPDACRPAPDPQDDLLESGRRPPSARRDSRPEADTSRASGPSRRVEVGERRDANRDVAQELHLDASGADGDDRTEKRVVGNADEHLDAALDHLLDEEAFEGSAGGFRRARPSPRRLARPPAGPEPRGATAPTSVLCRFGPDRLEHDGPADPAAASAASSGGGSAPCGTVLHHSSPADARPRRPGATLVATAERSRHDAGSLIGRRVLERRHRALGSRRANGRRRPLCASAIAACSGKANDGMRVPVLCSSSGSPFADIHVVTTGIRPPSEPTASAIACPISGAFVASGGM